MIVHHRANTSTPNNNSFSHINTLTLLLFHSALNPNIAGDLESTMGLENACSFQSLGYYLSTGSNIFLQDATCREPSAEDDSNTIANFIVYCG